MPRIRRGEPTLAKAKTAKPPAHRPAYWLLKSEPDSYSIDDLRAAPHQTTLWDGVRNYQARNFLRDTMRIGDRAFYYHSGADPLAIVGTVEIVSAAYPDPTAFDKRDHHYDPKSDPENPTWFVVDVKLRQKFPHPVTREVLKSTKSLEGMMLLQRGSRLSVQPVTPQEWKTVLALAGVTDA
ncbi:MAG: EVE domain-containing protein [Planctomycetaceae bacterium]|nr:EVE domain-containing protein [Planctomycetaceae bacterium]